jgi:hypothetical protein
MMHASGVIQTPSANSGGLPYHEDANGAVQIVHIVDHDIISFHEISM